MDKVDWKMLGGNENAIDLIEDNLDKVYDWIFLTQNPAAMHILQKNKKQIHWSKMACNSGIFYYDYKMMKGLKKGLHKNLIEWFWHPSRICGNIEDYEKRYGFDG